MPSKLLEADLVHSIVGGLFDVYNYFGYGLSERVYAGALPYELSDRRQDVAREVVVNVQYKERHVAVQRLDMVVDDRVIVEIKAAEKISDADRMQLISYLRATKFEVGLLLHFWPTAPFRTIYRLPKEIISNSLRRRTRAARPRLIRFVQIRVIRVQPFALTLPSTLTDTETDNSRSPVVG